MRSALTSAHPSRNIRHRRIPRESLHLLPVGHGDEGNSRERAEDQDVQPIGYHCGGCPKFRDALLPRRRRSERYAKFLGQLRIRRTIGHGTGRQQLDRAAGTA